jgi:hypothetical protein
LTTWLCKKIIVAKSKEVKTGRHLAESSKESNGSIGTALPMMMNMNLFKSRNLEL